jgi:hypothetical protein
VSCHPFTRRERESGPNPYRLSRTALEALPLGLSRLSKESVLTEPAVAPPIKRVVISLESMLTIVELLILLGVQPGRPFLFGLVTSRLNLREYLQVVLVSWNIAITHFRHLLSQPTKLHSPPRTCLLGQERSQQHKESDFVDSRVIRDRSEFKSINSCGLQ